MRGIRERIRRVDGRSWLAAASRLGEALPSVSGRWLPRAIRASYARQFLLMVVVIAVLTSGIGAANYLDTKRTLDRQVHGQVNSTAALQADGLDEWLDSKRLQTRALSAAKEFQLGDEQKIGTFLLSEGRTLGDDVVAVHYVQIASGNIIESTDRERAGTNASEVGLPWADHREHIDSVTNVASKVYVSEPYDDPATGERVVAFVSAVPANTEHVVVITASLEERATGFHQASAGAFTTVRQQDGRLVVTTRENASGEVASAARERSRPTPRSSATRLWRTPIGS